MYLCAVVFVPELQKCVVSACFMIHSLDELMDLIQGSARCHSSPSHLFVEGDAIGLRPRLRNHCEHLRLRV